MTVIQFPTKEHPTFGYLKAKCDFKTLPKEELLLVLAEQHENDFPWKHTAINRYKLSALFDVISERTSDGFVVGFVQDIRKELNV